MNRERFRSTCISTRVSWRISQLISQYMENSFFNRERFRSTCISTRGSLKHQQLVSQNKENSLLNREHFRSTYISTRVFHKTPHSLFRKTRIILAESGRFRPFISTRVYIRFLTTVFWTVQIKSRTRIRTTAFYFYSRRFCFSSFKTTCRYKHLLTRFHVICFGLTTVLFEPLWRPVRYESTVPGVGT